VGPSPEGPTVFYRFNAQRSWDHESHGLFCFWSLELEIKPSYPAFKRMADQGNLILVYREFLCDTETPVSAYLKIKEKSFSYLLESAYSDKKWGRYSFIGYKPYLTVLSRNRSMELVKGKERKVLKDIRDPMDVLRKLTKQFKPVILHEQYPFQGGMVGYFNYDLVRKWEYLHAVSPEAPMVPESILTISRRLIIFDHFTHKLNRDYHRN
jgi:anthranilate synthase component 1